MMDQSESLQSAEWYAWEDDESEQGWLLSYVDVLSVILAMLLVLLVSSLRLEEEAPQVAIAETEMPTAPPVMDAMLPAPRPLSLQSSLSAALPPPVPYHQMNPRTLAAAESSPAIAVDSVRVDTQADDAAMTVDGVEVVHHEDGVSLQISEVILFDSSQSELKATAEPVLERTIMLLREFGEVEVAVQGHTDNRPLLSGAYGSNWELAAARANAVAAFLLERDFPPDQLRVESYADTRPVAENTTDAGRSKNRRVELLVEFVDGA